MNEYKIDWHAYTRTLRNYVVRSLLTSRS